MSDDSRRPAAATKPAVRSAPASTLPGLPGAPPPPAPPASVRPVAPTLPGHAATAAPPAPAPPASARPVAPTLPGHAATTPALPGRPAGAMPTTPSAAKGIGTVEPQSPVALIQPNRRRNVALAAGGAAVAIIALVVGVRASRHAAPAKPAAAAPAPAAVAIAPVEAPAHPDEIAADQIPEPAPAAKEKPHVRHRPKAHRAVAHRERAVPAEKRHPAHKRALAMKEQKEKKEKKEKPTGDREAARAAYERGSDLLLTGNARGAVDAYQEAVRLAPADPVGYRGLGLAYEKEGKTKDAIAALVSYLKLSRHAHDREVIARRLYRLTHPE